MNIDNVIINAPETKKAAILTFIGVFVSLLLKLFTIIGEASFVTLILVSVGIGLIIYFEKSIQSFKFGLSGVEATRVLEAVVAKETEPSQSMFKLEAYGTDGDIKSVIKALGSSNYTFRNIEGMMRDTSLPENTVINALNWLITNNLAIESSGVGGNVYSLTPKGRSIFASSLVHV